MNSSNIKPFLIVDAGRPLDQLIQVILEPNRALKNISSKVDTRWLKREIHFLTSHQFKRYLVGY